MALCMRLAAPEHGGLCEPHPGAPLLQKSLPCLLPQVGVSRQQSIVGTNNGSVDKVVLSSVASFRDNLSHKDSLKHVHSSNGQMYQI